MIIQQITNTEIHFNLFCYHTGFTKYIPVIKQYKLRSSGPPTSSASIKWRREVARSVANKTPRFVLSDGIITNSFTVTVWVTNTVAVVGEGVAEVDGTAILKSALRWSTFSRLSESVLNALLSLPEFRVIAVCVLLRPGANGKISYMLETRRLPLSIGRYTCQHLVGAEETISQQSSDSRLTVAC